MINLYLMILETDADKSLFEELYKKYKARMYKYAYSILHNKEDAEDVVHQAFLTIANIFEKFKAFSCHEMDAYIVILIRNTSINLYNKNKRSAERYAEFDEEQIAVDVDYFDKINYEYLVKIISKLPLIYKEVLLLRYVEDFSVKHISKISGISVDGVRKRIERAKKLLKEEIESGEYYGK